MIGLDLFSGIGGITLALSPWVRPVAYCEIDRYAQAVLLSRMAEGKLPIAPIWDDIRTLRGDILPSIDIVYGGFPCQDISCAGRGEGLEGKRSGLFFEIVRLAEEIQPAWIFLENVPAIRTRGLDTVIRELFELGYDCRWGMLSAFDMGAPHKRERWFLLAYGKRKLIRDKSGRIGGTKRKDQAIFRDDGEAESFSNSNGSERRSGDPAGCDMGNILHSLRPIDGKESPGTGELANHDWWSTEPDVGRVVNGLPFRVDRIKCLGNSVVPSQAREAFKRLMGLK